MFKKLPLGDCILEIATGLQIPPEPGNSDYQRVLKFIEDGGKIQDSEPLVMEKQVTAQDVLDLLQTKQILTAQEVSAVTGIADVVVKG